MRFLLINILFCIGNICCAQLSNSNLDIYSDGLTRKAELQVPEYIFKNSGVLVKYNPLSLLTGGAMMIYQKVVTKQISSDCLYRESCSKFGVSVIREYGLLKGAFLSSDRIMRCNRFTAQDSHIHRFDEDSQRLIDPLRWYE